MARFMFTTRAVRLAIGLTVLSLMSFACGGGATSASPAPSSSAAITNVSPALAEMIAKASKEGEVVFNAPPSRTGLPVEQEVASMEKLVKDLFGVTIKVKFDSTGTFNAATAKMLTEIQTGSPPSYDLSQQNTFASGPPLWIQNALEPIAWTKLFTWIKDEDTVWDGKAVVVETQFIQPEYNTKLVTGGDVPKSWEDLLQPKWRGKISLLINPDPWVLMAQPGAWGKDKAVDYLKRLMALQPTIGRFPEVHDRVVSGETPVAMFQQVERGATAQLKGAPIAFAKVDPVLLWPAANVVPKGARSANAAALLAAAFLTEAGQAHMLKFQGSSSIFRANSAAANDAKGRTVIIPNVAWQVSEGLKLQDEINKILTQK
jgi:ABC-type Fe3+ transport system substrate-binding protein